MPITVGQGRKGWFGQTTVIPQYRYYSTSLGADENGTKERVKNNAVGLAIRQKILGAVAGIEYSHTFVDSSYSTTSHTSKDSSRQNTINVSLGVVW